MTRLERQSQLASNGHNEYSSLSPRDRRLFVNNVTKAPAPDIDSAKEILLNVQKSYGALGVPSKDRKRIAQGLETKLYEGTAGEQARASEALQSIELTHRALKETFQGRKRVR